MRVSQDALDLNKFGGARCTASCFMAIMAYNLISSIKLLQQFKMIACFYYSNAIEHPVNKRMIGIYHVAKLQRFEAVLWPIEWT